MNTHRTILCSPVFIKGSPECFTVCISGSLRHIPDINRFGTIAEKPEILLEERDELLQAFREEMPERWRKRLEAYFLSIAAEEAKEAEK